MPARWRLTSTVAALTFPTTNEPASTRAPLYEALIQGRQLIGLTEVWSAWPKKVLVAKLDKVFKGPEMPRSETHAVDDARNTLLELSMARYLSLCSFKVSI